MVSWTKYQPPLELSPSWPFYCFIIARVTFVWVFSTKSKSL